MTEKIKELLTVLNTPEDSPEQYGWLLSIAREHNVCCPYHLAFRLRDEVKKNHPEEWLKACFIVSESITNPGTERAYREYLGYEAESFVLSQGPIIWIIAALIAKELVKERNG